MTQIDESTTVVLDGSGNGTAILGPQRVREKWTLTYASVSASTAVVEATCTLYRGIGTVRGKRISGTATGSSGDTCGLANMELQPGQTLLAVFTGGDAGAVATLNAYGEKARMGT